MKINSLSCGILGCPEPGILRFAIDRWDIQGKEDLASDSGEIVFQKLRCIDGLRAIDIDGNPSENIAAELNFLICGRILPMPLRN